MNILNLLVQYLNGAYSATYAPERGRKMEIKVAGTVKRILHERIYEVKSQQDGYFVIKEEDIE